VLFLLQTGTAFPANPPVSQNADSTTASTDTFDVTEAKMLIIYPKGKLIVEAPHRSRGKNRGGSFACISFNIRHENIILQEILFHTLESCSTFAIEYEKHLGGPYDEGEGFPKRWYSPQDFNSQKNAFLEDTPIQDYVPIVVDSIKYLNYCQRYSYAGVSGAEHILFYRNIRIMIVMISDENCDKIEKACKNLLSKIEIKPYDQRKKKNER